MTITVREYEDKDIKQMLEIWNEIVLEGTAFPQIECLCEDTGREFFSEQSYCGVAENEICLNQDDNERKKAIDDKRITA